MSPRLLGPGEFRLVALHEALDAARRERGWSWPEVARDIHRAVERSGARPLADSTLTGLRGRSAAEADGVLQMLRWLGRSPESFAPGHALEREPAALLPQPAPGRILRLDTRRLHAALDEARRARALRWAALGRELGMHPGSLRRLAQGGRTSFPQVLRVTTWLGGPAARWTVGAER